MNWTMVTGALLFFSGFVFGWVAHWLLTVLRVAGAHIVARRQAASRKPVVGPE